MNRLAHLAGTAALTLSLASGQAVAQTPESHLAHHPGTVMTSGQGQAAMPGTTPGNGQPGPAMGVPRDMGARGSTAAAMPSMMEMMQMMRLMGGMMTRGAAMSAVGMMRFDHIAGRIAFLRAELGITAAQQPEWTAFASALQAAATKVEPMQKEMLLASVNGAAPMPEQLHAEASLIDARAAAVHAIVRTATKLYAVLTPAQRTKADALMAGPQGMM